MSALKQQTWLVAQYKNEIRNGDLVYLWDRPSTLAIMHWPLFHGFILTHCYRDFSSLGAWAALSGQTRSLFWRCGTLSGCGCVNLSCSVFELRSYCNARPT